MIIPTILRKLLTDYLRYTIIGMVAGILVLGYFLFLDKKIVGLQQGVFRQRELTKEELVAEQKYAEELSAALGKFQATFRPEVIAQIDEFLPSQSDFPKLLMMVNSIAQTGGVKLDIIGVDQVAAAGGGVSGNVVSVAGLNLRAQDLTVGVSGGKGYDDFKNLLTLIESSRQLFDISALTFSQPAGTTAAPSSGGYSFVMRTYYLPGSENATP